METIKYTIGLVFQLVFGVAATGTYLKVVISFYFPFPGLWILFVLFL